METPGRDSDAGAAARPSPSAMATTMMLDGPGGQSRSVKRPRPVKSCTECRKRKLKCDRLCPCSQCQKSHRVCKYAAADSDNPNLSDGASDVDAAERPPKRLTSRPAQALPQDGAAPSFTLNGSDVQQITAALIDEFSGRLDRLERLVVAKDHGRSSPDTSLSVPTHHHHHLLQPPRPLSTTSSTMRTLTVKGSMSLRTRYFGQNTTRVLLSLFEEARDFMQSKHRREPLRDLFMGLQAIYATLQEDQRKALAPITVYVDSMMPIQKRMADILPRRPVCDRLLESYINTSEGLYRILHIPTLRAEYEAYWDEGRYSDGFLPRLLCILCIGSRFETDSRGLCHDRAEGVHIPTACALVPSWLDNLRGKQLVDVSTLQAEVLLLHAQRMIAPRYQNTWTQLGLIARMAMTMGLHRDPSEFRQISPFVGESRRRLWFTIMDMDLHVALACSLPSAVKDGEYTCKPPRNLNDADLYPEMTELPPGQPLDHFTDSQLQVYAASTFPYRLKANDLICRLDAVRDYSEIVELGTKLERILDDISYLFPRNKALGTKNQYRDWRMRAILDMHIRRPLLALYRPFALSAADCPPHISSVYLKSSMAMLTYMEDLDPSLPGYDDVNQMYHVILKHDISQAAFSVCFYIKKSSEGGGSVASSPTPSSNHHWGGPAASPEPPEPGYGNPGENRLIWSRVGMIKVVEKNLDALIALVKDASTDLKDVMALSIVLASVRPAATPEQRLDRIRAGLMKVYDGCRERLAMKPSSGAAGALINLPPAPVELSKMTADWYNTAPRQPLLPSEIATNGSPDDFPLWDMDFWDTSNMPADQS